MPLIIHLTLRVIFLHFILKFICTVATESFLQTVHELWLHFFPMINAAVFVYKHVTPLWFPPICEKHLAKM